LLRRVLNSKEAVMPSSRTTKAKRASAANTQELRALRQATGSEPRAKETSPSSIQGTDEAAGRPAQRRAIEQAMARQNARLGRSPGAIGPIGRTLLLIGLFALVGLIAVWVLLAL
jgi:hypothetical protein